MRVSVWVGYISQILHKFSTISSNSQDILIVQDFNNCSKAHRNLLLGNIQNIVCQGYSYLEIAVLVY